jgi:hypothetical protein
MVFSQLQIRRWDDAALIEFTLNRRAGRAVASFYGSAVPAEAKIRKAQTCSRYRRDRNNIWWWIASN